MTHYVIETTPEFDAQFKKLDRSVQKKVLTWIAKHLENTDNPRAYGKALRYEFKGLWRYRIGNYRLLTRILDDKLIIFMIHIEKRDSVYD